MTVVSVVNASKIALKYNTKAVFTVPVNHSYTCDRETSVSLNGTAFNATTPLNGTLTGTLIVSKMHVEAFGSGTDGKYSACKFFNNLFAVLGTKIHYQLVRAKPFKFFYCSFIFNKICMTQNIVYDFWRIVSWSICYPFSHDFEEKTLHSLSKLFAKYTSIKYYVKLNLKNVF